MAASKNALGTAFEFDLSEKAAPRGGGALIVPLIAKPAPALELIARIDPLCNDRLSQLLEVQSVPEECGQLAHTSSESGYQRVLLVSLGDRKKLDLAGLRSAAAAAARWLISEKLDRAGLWIEGLATAEIDNALGEWAAAMSLTGFRFHEYMAPKPRTPAHIRIDLHGARRDDGPRQLADVRRVQALVEAVNYSRRLAHLPPNVINPRTLADEARALAKQAKLRCAVHDIAKLKKLGAGGLLAVGQGAEHPPCLIELEYRGAPKARDQFVFVGKAITFDTGGYSIKPAEGLEKMKFDKCGGMQVLGILKAASTLKLRCNVVGLIAAAENSVSDRAYRPADILHMASGKTVEVNNTDAEGRLVLADALWYAQKNFRPAALVDLATLTGGVRIALGTACAGLMSTDDNLAAELEECGRRTGERLWRLPLWDDYRELIKSSEADIKNSAGKRDAHPIVGGMFLREFIEPGVPWAHLDIAAVANIDEAKGPYAKGATGFGIRLLIDFLRSRGA